MKGTCINMLAFMKSEAKIRAPSSRAELSRLAFPKNTFAGTFIMRGLLYLKFSL